VTYFVITYLSGGYTGSPGYTKLKFLPAASSGPTGAEVNAAAAAGRALLGAYPTFMPTGVTYACQSPAQIFNDSGMLTGEAAISSLPTNVIGTGGTAYPGGVGGVVYWNTSGFNGGHKVRGRTFLVPMATNAFGNDGTLQTSLVTALQTAVNAFVASSPPPCVNTRRLGNPARVDGTVQVISGTVKDRTAFLRTRRT
jgi:hypothetical protein